VGPRAHAAEGQDMHHNISIHHVRIHAMMFFQLILLVSMVPVMCEKSLDMLNQMQF
jgi:hypothetical protein